MSIIRVQHDKNTPYLVVSKSTISDKSLSFEARGFLVHLLGKPDDWEIRPKELAKESGIHPATVYRLLKQLIRGGYVVREDIKRRTPQGRFEQGSLYFVYEHKREPQVMTVAADKEVLLNGERIPF